MVRAQQKIAVAGATLKEKDENDTIERRKSLEIKLEQAAEARDYVLSARKVSVLKHHLKKLTSIKVRVQKHLRKIDDATAAVSQTLPDNVRTNGT